MFTATPLLESTLAPGASTTFEVAFTAMNGGLKAAVLSISSNDAGNSPFTVTLQAIGMRTDPEIIPQADAPVFALATQADDKILVGGSILLGGFFTQVAGHFRQRIARLLPDGTVDSIFNPSANGWGNAIAIQGDGRILVTGGFTNISGQARERVARLQKSFFRLRVDKPGP